jgi:hypothetical protein
LTRSIFSTLGLDIDNPLELTPSVGPQILILIDGFGSFILDGYGSQVPNIEKLSVDAAQLRSHFPTTTVTNLTSLGTGELPSRHGMVGYTMRIPFASEGTPQLLNGLKWDPRIDPLTWQRQPTLFERGSNIGIQSHHVASRRYEGSGFTLAALRGATYLPAQSDDEILAAIEVATGQKNSFTYIYLNDVDEAGHGFGVGSSKWLSALQRVDELIRKIVERLPQGSRLWMTADHGMVNAGEKIVLGEGNRLLDEVNLLGGEPRARHLYLTGEGVEERMETVKKNWRDFFGDRIELLEAREAFGSDIDPAHFDRIGDIIAVPKDETVLLELERKEAQSRMVGHHGAQTEIELAIPLRLFMS